MRAAMPLCRVVCGSDAYDFRKAAADVHVAGQGNFTGQGENEFDGRTWSEVSFTHKI